MWSFHDRQARLWHIHQGQEWQGQEWTTDAWRRALQAWLNVSQEGRLLFAQVVEVTARFRVGGLKVDIRFSIRKRESDATGYALVVLRENNVSTTFTNNSRIARHDIAALESTLYYNNESVDSPHLKLPGWPQEKCLVKAAQGCSDHDVHSARPNLSPEALSRPHRRNYEPSPTDLQAIDYPKYHPLCSQFDGAPYERFASFALASTVATLTTTTTPRRSASLSEMASGLPSALSPSHTPSIHFPDLVPMARRRTSPS